MTSPNSTSPLLSLPRELRDKIYSFCFSFDGVQHGINARNATVLARSKESNSLNRCSTAVQNEVGIPPKSTPGILLVSKQVYDEALPWIGTQELCIMSPLVLRGSAPHHWNGSRDYFAKALLPNHVLACLQCIRFCFRVQVSEAVKGMENWDSHSSQHLYGSRMEGDVFEAAGRADYTMLHGRAWAQLWTHVLDVLIASPGVKQRQILTFEMHCDDITPTGGQKDIPAVEIKTRTRKYEVPVHFEKLSKLKMAVWVSWLTGRYEVLLRCLEAYVLPAKDVMPVQDS